MFQQLAKIKENHVFYKLSIMDDHQQKLVFRTEPSNFAWLQWQIILSLNMIIISL